MNLIDGYNGGVAHITAPMIRDHNISLYGENDYVTALGSKFGVTVVDNNTITIGDGMGVMQGGRFGINYGEQETCVITNGIAGYKRVDIIAAEYSKDSVSLKESVSLVVIKGSAGSTYDDPATVTGNIRAGATSHQMPLYRIKIDGLSIDSVEKMWTPAVVPVESGGTGANTAEDAKANLDIVIPDPKFVAPVAITLPYTATQDGIVSYFVAPSSNANSYLYIKSSFLNGNDIARTSSVGLGHGTSFPIHKGETISRNTSANGSINMYFTALTK